MSASAGACAAPGRRDTVTGYDYRYDAPLPPSQAIRAHCLECVGGELAEVLRCTATNEECPLWRYRSGRGKDTSRPSNGLTRLQAIRQECLRCMGGNKQFVRECASSHCHLWPYRFGCRPKDHPVLSVRSGGRSAKPAR